MFKKSREFYVKVALSVVVVLLVINLFNLPGNGLIKRAVAAIGTITGEGNTSYLVRFVGAAPTNSIADSIIYDSGTRVGIGTAVPAGRLTISGGYVTTGISGASVTLSGAGTSPNAGQLIFGDGTGWKFHIGNPVSGTFTERMTFQDDGKVGIGTTAPGYKLQVAGDIYASSGWLRSAGATGWYNETYGGGWYMADSTYLRAYADKYVLAPHFYSSTYSTYLPAGTGTTNYLTKWTGTYQVGNSAILDDGTTVTSSRPIDITGGSLSDYTVAPIEIRTTANPRVSFHWPGVVASQIGMDSSGIIRTYDNPGTGYASFAAGNGTFWNGLMVRGAALTIYAQNMDIQTNANFSMTNSYPSGKITLTASGGIFTTNPLQVGSGTITPGTSVLKIIGLTGASGTALHIDSNGNVYYFSSSRKTKDNIKDFSDDWNKIFKLSPKSFTYKTNGIKSMGYIAEDVEEAGLKELVNYDNDGLPMSLSYDKFVVYLVEQARVQKDKISDLEARIEKLEQIINNK